MKITKFAQSCVLIETKGKRILIDPGFINLEESKPLWTDINIILVTHKHGDHCHVETIKELISKYNAALYTTVEVQEAKPEFNDIMIELIKAGDIIELDNIKIEVTKAIHGYIPPLKGGNEINDNVGYIIDDGNKRVYLTSDIICFQNNYKADIVFVPVCNHGLVMGPFEAALFAKETDAELVIPYHHDNPKYPADMDKVNEEFTKQGLNFKIMNVGETIEL
ncbi:MBL fold metallo-hydrolase [Nanoarchaeota archaeon]